MTRKLNNETDSEFNYLANIADLISAFLFIVLIALAFMAVQLYMSDEAHHELPKLAEQLGELEKQVKELSVENKSLKEETQSLEKIKAERDAYASRLISLSAAEEDLKSQRTELQKKMRVSLEELESMQGKILGANLARTSLLKQIESKLREEGIQIQIEPSTGVLRLPEDAITFESGSANLREKYKKRLFTLGRALSSELKCYEPSGVANSSCLEINPMGYTLDAVFIEGHTDNKPFGGDTTGRLNLALSTERANTIYSELKKTNAELFSFKNPKGQQLFSLSGYGEERPLEGHKHEVPTSDETNRRIEIRFVMATPELSEQEFDSLKKKIEAVNEF